MDGTIKMVMKRTVIADALAVHITRELGIGVEVVQSLDLATTQRGSTRLVILDPLTSGLVLTEVAAVLRKRGVPFAVFLPSADDAAFTIASWGMGAATILLRTSNTEDTIYGVRKALEGRRCVPTELAESSLMSPGKRTETNLTPRERAVLSLISVGLMIKEVAEQLGISPKTAETHLYNLGRKLGTSSRARLTAYALDFGLITLDHLRSA